MQLLHLYQALFSLVLLLGSDAALGEWERVMQDEHGTTYADPGSVHKALSGGSLWTLYDAEVPYLYQVGEYVHSSRVQTEFDCQNNSARTLNVVRYAERMGKGKVVRGDSTPEKWEPIDPSTGRATLIKLVCSSSPVANARWEKLGSNRFGTVYYDPNSIQRSSDIVKLRYLVDLDKMPARKNRYISAINLAEYDCIGKKSRLLHITEYSDAMGAGEILLSIDSTLEWDSVETNTVAELMWNAACRFKKGSANANSAPPVPEFENLDQRLAYLQWSGANSEKLKGFIPDWEVRRDLLQTVWYESRRAGIDPSLVLGLAETVSAFRKFFVSENGSRGYMAVSPRWTKKLGDGDAEKLFHMQTNFRYGCVILRHLMEKRKGDLLAAVDDYYTENLADSGKPEVPVDFTRIVFANAKKWESVSR